MDSSQDYDVHSKDGIYYSERTTSVAGFVNTLITFVEDGSVYNLDPDKKTGTLVTTTTMKKVLDTPVLMDKLYAAISEHAQEAEFVTEEREIDGVTYTAEAFAATEYKPEAVFCYDENGDLAVFIEGAPVVKGAADIGESVYTIEVIDDKVDNALFDISDYTVE